jgi:YD repeat-containing protein
MRRRYWWTHSIESKVVISHAIPARGYEHSCVESYSPNVDLNNNVTGIKPPGRDWHRFTYDITDNLDGYQPPTLAGVSNPNTSYGYNLHPRLTGVTRPDGRNVSVTQIPGMVGPANVQTPLGTYFYTYDAGKPNATVGPVQNDGIASCTPSLQNFYDGALLKRQNSFGCKGTGIVEWQYNNFFEPRELKITAGATPAYVAAMSYDRDGFKPKQTARPTCPAITCCAATISASPANRCGAPIFNSPTLNRCFAP